MAKKSEPKYPFKDLYCQELAQLLGVEVWAEYKFHPTRKWRFDYAIPDLQIAIEIDGGVFIGGRHSRGMGQKKDMEKMNAAAEMGWLVFHFVPREKLSQQVTSQLWKTIKMRRNNEKA